MEKLVYLCKSPPLDIWGMYSVLILYDIWSLSLPLHTLVLLTQPIQPLAHTCGGIEAGSDQ
jgi:hypothetical protein